MTLSRRFSLIGMAFLFVALIAIDLPRLSAWELAIGLTTLAAGLVCAHSAGVAWADASPSPLQSVPPRKYCEMCDRWFVSCRQTDCPHCGDVLVPAKGHLARKQEA